MWPTFGHGVLSPAHGGTPAPRASTLRNWSRKVNVPAATSRCSVGHIAALCLATEPSRDAAVVDSLAGLSDASSRRPGDNRGGICVGHTRLYSQSRMTLCTSRSVQWTGASTTCALRPRECLLQLARSHASAAAFLSSSASRSCILRWAALNNPHSQPR